MAVVLLALALGGCGELDEMRPLKLAHNLPTQHPVHQALAHMAERVSELSEGALRVQVYSDAQLGSERVVLEMLQIGSLDMTKVSAAALAGFAPSYSVLEMPYLFENDEHRFRALEGAPGRQILQDGSEFWLRGLAFLDAGSRSFYTCNGPIEEPGDLRGLKIRVMGSQNAVAMMNHLGGSATPIDFGELYTALQQGVVDGAENNPPSFFSSRHYEVCKHFALDEHTSIPDVLIIGTKTWDRLTEQQQEWLRQAAEESAELQKELWADAEEASMEAIVAAGVEVTHPPKEPFQEAVAPMYEALRARPELHRLVEAIRALADEPSGSVRDEAGSTLDLMEAS